MISELAAPAAAAPAAAAPAAGELPVEAPAPVAVAAPAVAALDVAPSKRKRRVFTVEERLEAINICDRIYANVALTNKQDAWADPAINPKYCAIAFAYVQQWRKPETRQNLTEAV